MVIFGNVSGLRFLGFDNMTGQTHIVSLPACTNIYTHACQNDPHENNHKICMENGFKPVLTGYRNFKRNQLGLYI